MNTELRIEIERPIQEVFTDTTEKVAEWSIAVVDRELSNLKRLLEAQDEAPT